MRYSASYRSASRDNYNKFCQQHPSTKISYKEFSDIIYAYNGQIMSHIVETGDLIPLPRGFGKVTISRKKTKTTFKDVKGTEHIILPINWPESNKRGKIVHYYNDHSFGFRFKWMWFKDTSTNLKMADIWCFKPARKWSLAITAVTRREDSKKYIYQYGEWEANRKKKNA